MRIMVTIGGRELPEDLIDAWEMRTSERVARRLERAFGLDGPRRLIERGSAGLADVRRSLTDAKLQIDPQRLRDHLDRQMRFSAASAKLTDAASMGRRKASVVEITCEGSTARDIVCDLEALFTTSSPRNRELLLMGAPDHYVVEAGPGGVQELVENFGGAPTVSQFFITYGVPDEQIAHPRDLTYPEQMVGLARLRDGTPAGGVRHQYRDEGDGFRAKIADESPALLPARFVRGHQVHLACEFRIWYRELVQAR